jgi:conjugal transfer pilus assembly protein TraV
MRVRATLAWASLLALGGCVNLSGLDGTSSHACKAPEGVNCDSVSGTYANALQNNLPGRRPQAAAPEAPATPVIPASTPSRTTSALATRTSQTTGPNAVPLRSSARILRLWFKPWEDADRDLYDQGYVYVQIDSGRWLVEHAQREIREAYAPLRPPPRAAAASDGREPAAAAPSTTTGARPVPPPAALRPARTAGTEASP